MKQIAITGGKGGVGKSTVAILLANQFREEGKKVVLYDADVECPNDFLLLGQALAKPKKKITALLPEVDKAKCQRCGQCVSRCRAHALFRLPGQAPQVISELCSGCGLCWQLCRAEAIKPREKLIGEVFVNQVEKSFWLVTGRTVGVVEESGPVVSKAKEFACQLALEKGADYFLVDTAVGTHCGVIRALMGANKAYAVTEPTPLGAHDLSLILRLIGELAIPTEIIVNQADLGEIRLVEEVAAEFETKITQKIPHSPEIAQAYAKGELGKFNYWGGGK